MDNKEDKDSSRRKFLRNIGLIGTASVAGGLALYSGSEYEKRKKKGSKITALTPIIIPSMVSELLALLRQMLRVARFTVSAISSISVFTSVSSIFYQFSIF